MDKYHEWMKDEELQTLTASEGLSLQVAYLLLSKVMDNEPTILMPSEEKAQAG